MLKHGMTQTDPQDVIRRARRLRALFFDADGTLTNGMVTVGPGGEEFFTFSKRDGKGLSLLREAGLHVGIVTGNSSWVIAHRFAGLADTVEQGLDTAQEKLQFVADKCAQLGISMNDIGYMGDDLNDLECLQSAGFSACPSDAIREVRAIVDMISHEPGGRHAAREVCDFILEARKAGGQ